MNSQDELQLSDDLRHLVADPPFVPDIEAIERRGRRQRRRGLAVRGLAGLSVAGVAVAGVAVGTHHGTTGEVAGRTTSSKVLPLRSRKLAIARALRRTSASAFAAVAVMPLAASTATARSSTACVRTSRPTDCCEGSPTS